MRNFPALTWKSQHFIMFQAYSSPKLYADKNWLWAGSFHSNMYFICASHHPCNKNLLFVDLPCQIQTYPKWSSSPPCPPPCFFLSFFFLTSKTLFFIGLKTPFFNRFLCKRFFNRFYEKRSLKFLSVFTKKRFFLSVFRKKHS